MALRKLHLYGPLADQFGTVHEVAAATISDALRIVECNHPGFGIKVKRGGYHCAIGDGRVDYSETENTIEVARGTSSAEEIDPHALFLPRSKGDFHLVPALTGAKGRTFKTVFSIVVGGALLFTGVGGAAGVSAIAGGSGVGGTVAAVGSGVLGLSAGTTALLGAGLFLGGLNSLLAPTPQTNVEDESPTSFSFSGPSERSDEGGAIPILIGELIIGHTTIASSIESTGTGGGSYTYGGVSGGGGKGGSRYDFQNVAQS